MVPRKTTPARRAPRPPTLTASASAVSNPTREADGAVIVRSLARERRVERLASGREVDGLHEVARLGRAVLPVHPDVFPLHRERAAVARRVEMTDHFLEVDPAAAERAELPEAIRMAEVQ